jgi:hypothetical protein
MKKLIIVLLALLPLVSFGQRIYTLDSFPVPSGTDTIIYKKMITGVPWSIEFDYTALNKTDGTLDLGQCAVPDTLDFNRLDDLRLPFTLADSSVVFEKSTFPSRYIQIKFTKGTNTTGKRVYYWITKI